MRHIRKRLTYSNVMSSIAVFLVLGGAAYAASQLPRNSVGTKQLKRNAVTTAKIKKGAVNGNKIADGSITGVDINTRKTPFSHVVAKLRGSTALALTGEPQVFALNPSTYTQAGEEDDTYLGAVDITFPSGCEAPRSAVAFLMVDPTNPAKVEPVSSLVGLGVTEDKVGGDVTKRIEIAPFSFPEIPASGYRFEPGTAKSHTVNLAVLDECKSGSGVTATFGGVDVIGTK